MKKFLFTMVLLFSTILSISAQTAIENPKILDNVYIGVNAGLSMPLSFDNAFPLNPTVGVRIGKEFNSIFGAAIEGTGWFGSTAAHGTRFSWKNDVRAINTGLIGTVNLLNAFKFQEARKFDLEAVAGIGWLHRFNWGDDANDISAKTAIDLGWNFGNHKIYVEPAIYWNLTGGSAKAQFNSSHAQIAGSIGYIYKFKTSNGTHNFKAYDIAALNDEINSLRAKVEELEGRPVEIAEFPVEVIKEVEVEKITKIGDVVVTFAQGSADLTDSAKAILNTVSGQVKVVATASPEGTKRFNQKLSEKRAQIVKEYLEANGVTVISADGLGVTGKDSNRIAVISIVE